MAERKLEIRALRRITQTADEPPVYIPFRKASIYLTVVLLKTRETPNQVSASHLAALLLASSLMALATWPARLTAAALLLFSYVLDCVDGELARARSVASKTGAQIEQVVHWVGSAACIIGATGGSRSPGSAPATVAWFLGMLALVGDSTYHFIYYQLNLYATPGRNYGLLHPITRWLYRFMPLDTNLLVVGCLIGQLLPVLAIWAAVSLSTSLAVFLLYLRIEIRAERLSRIPD